MFTRREFLLTAISSATASAISTKSIRPEQANAVHLFKGASNLNPYRTKQTWGEGLVDLITIRNAHTKPIYALSISPNNRFIASGGADYKIKIWNLETESTDPIQYSASYEVETLEFSPDGKLLVSGSMDGNILVWEVESPSNTPLYSLTSHAPNDGGVAFGGVAFTAVAFSPDGNILATSGGDKKIRLWNINAGSMIAELSEEQYVFSLEFSPEGNRLVSTGARNVINIWDWRDARKIESLAFSEGPIYALAFSPVEEGMLAFSPKIFNVDERRSEESVYSVRIWNVEDAELQASMVGHEKDVLALAFSPNGQTLASASSDGTFKLWDTETFELIRSFNFHTGRVWSIEFNVDGSRFATSSADYSIKLWTALD